MRIVGFDGGSSLFELGSISDMQFFFDGIESFVVPFYPEFDWPLLTDRFYRRYLRPEELAPAQQLMDKVKTVFERTPSSDVDWSNMSSPNAVTRLDPSKPNLAEIYAKYFEAFAHCRESAEISHYKWNEYQPLKVVVTDFPRFFVDKDRPLGEYEALEGEPFWKR